MEEKRNFLLSDKRSTYKTLKVKNLKWYLCLTSPQLNRIAQNADEVNVAVTTKRQNHIFLGQNKQSEPDTTKESASVKHISRKCEKLVFTCDRNNSVAGMNHIYSVSVAMWSFALT